MTLICNGRDVESPDGSTLEDFVRTLAPGRVAVERNGKLVPRREWGETRLEAGDRLEVVQFVGGGAAS